MSQEWKAPTPDPDDVQMPLGAGGGGGETPTEEYSPATPKLKINTSTLALVLAFVAALVVLYFLGQQNKPRTASAAELQQSQEVDRRIEDWMKSRGGKQLDLGLGNKTESLVAWLTSYFDRNLSGGVADPGVNPFEREVKAEPTPTNVTPTVFNDTGPVVDPLIREAGIEYSSLKLQLIMKGNPSSAMINNQMVHVGTKFKYLTVTDIQADCVILSYKDMSMALKDANAGK